MVLRLLLLLLVFTFESIGITKNLLKISTFNVKLYGMGGEWVGQPSDEYRDFWIREFMSATIGDSDVIVFQEIVNDKHFISERAKGGFNCLSYSHNDEKHQHVVICYLATQYDFAKEEGDDNYTMEEVAFGRLRPALHGTLTGKDGKHLIRIVGVHLKASLKDYETRYKQVALITKGLKSVDNKIPTIVLGDFNTYDQTNDVGVLTENFKEVNLVHINNFDHSTYMTPQWKSRFDHFWVSSTLEGASIYKVYGPCAIQGDITSKSKYDNLYFYNRFISDHCPVSLTLELE